MKIRKNAFALLLVVIAMSSLVQNKAKAIIAVTDEKKIVLCQSTNSDNRQKQDNYILLNRPNGTNTKEYLHAYTIFTEKGIYVDGIDPVPVELFKHREGYLSLGLQLFKCQFGNCMIDIGQVADIGFIGLSLTEDPIYWRIFNDKDVFGITKEDLEDSENIRGILPKKIEGLRGYMMIKGEKKSLITGQIDIVPFDTGSKESIFGIKNFINLNDFTYNQRQYQFILESQDRNPVLSVTANYYFNFNVSRDSFIHNPFICKGDNDCSDITIEGEITLTINYEIIE